MTRPGPSLDILVLMGGWSAERDVSLTSGRACAAALQRQGHDVRELDLHRNLEQLCRNLDPAPDAVFNALHGRGGEDGTVQGVLNLAGVPYTHSGLNASALAMNKPQAKAVLAQHGLQVPAGRIARRSEVLADDVLPQPYVVKPLAEGSSVGVHIVDGAESRAALAGAAWPFGEHVLVESFVPGREVTVAVMGERALAVTEIHPVKGFYDYQAKYSEGRASHVVPASVPGPVEAALKEAAVRAHALLGCRGVTRADFRYDDRHGGSNGLYLLEINTQPGMTPLSLVPEQAAHLGIGFDELCQWMIDRASFDA